MLTGPELLGRLEALLPEYRERKYPPTVTLAMFLGQVLSADGSCQNAVNEAVVSQLLRGLVRRVNLDENRATIRMINLPPVDRSRREALRA